MPSLSQGLALTTLCLAVLAAQIDTAVVNLALQPIAQNLNADLSRLQWILDAYNLAYAALLLSGGLLTDLYGRRRVFVIGAAVLSVSTLLCAMAPGLEALIAARAISGVGAALLIPASLALIRILWLDSAQRARVLGLWAACNGLAMALGPTLGGVLIASAGWRSVFLAAVPLGLLAAALAPMCISESRSASPRSVDMAGQSAGAAALGALLFAAIEFQHRPGLALATLLLGVLATLLFIRIERGLGSRALAPLALFASRPFNTAMTATFTMTFGMYGVLFLLPLFWQASGLLDPLGAGIALMPTAIAFMLVSPCSGKLSARHGASRIAACGLALMGTGLSIIGLTAATASLGAQQTGLLLTGVGMGLATATLTEVAINTVPTEHAGTAGALVNTARMTGASLGVALLGAIFAVAAHPADGMRLALLAGSAVQFAGALVAWCGLLGHRHAQG